MAWNVAIGVVVIIFVVAIVVARSGGSANGGGGPPRAANPDTGEPGDHWHTYLGVNICGQWLPPVPAFEQPVGSPAGTQAAGIHSHGDGLIHTHPYVESEEGTNATVGKYAHYGGWSVSSDSIDAWAAPKGAPNQKSWSNGDTCTFGPYKGKKGQIVWAVDNKPRTGNPSDYQQQDGTTVAIGFLPKDTKLDFPPDACNAFANISDQQTAAVVSKDSPCREQVATTTTQVPASTEPPSTTLAP
ncbi:MAG TPA: hypothetical protein VEP49_07180 [Acidimicrobiia bacterium]|nr:hypothetical protein [Acidimicrobiia bacterium]